MSGNEPDPEQTEPTSPVPFDAAEAYRALGWSGTIPLPPKAKFPPPAGFTGGTGKIPTPADIAGWRSQGYRIRGEGGLLVQHQAHNIGLRLPRR